MTRAELLRRTAAAGAALSLPGLFPAIARADKPKLAKVLNFSNWPLYIDVDKRKRHPSLDRFTKRYGVKVNYMEDIDDNASFFEKIEGPLSRHQSIGRDIIVMTDNSRFPSELIKLGWLEKLDKSAIPNIKNLQPALQHPSWDPHRDYSLPWQSAMTGIAYNSKLTKPVTSVTQLLTDPQLKGKVTLLTEMGDTIGCVMLENGDDPSNVSGAAFDRAVNTVQKAVDSDQIRQFTGNEYAPLLAKGDVWAALARSGDIVQLQADNPNLHWLVPKAGGMIWTDNMLIPKGGKVYTASVFMNFVYSPVIAAEIEDYVNYVCPVVGADRVLLKTAPKVAENPLVFPSRRTLSRVHAFDAQALSNEDYSKKFQHLLGA